MFNQSGGTQEDGKGKSPEHYAPGLDSIEFRFGAQQQNVPGDISPIEEKIKVTETFYNYWDDAYSLEGKLWPT